MLIRSSLLLVTAILLAACQAPAPEAPTGPDVTAQTAETQAAITPAAALQMLKDGNARFVSGQPYNRDFAAEVQTTASGQFPFGVVLGCIDSRVPPEIVFDAGIGDIFSARVAGNFENEDILGSVEFATAVAGSKVVVVLGHTECGAVKGACDNVELGNITPMLANIMPAVDAVIDVDGARDSSNKAFVEAVTHQNVEATIADMLARSEVLAGLVESGDVMIVGAIHDVGTGVVTFME